MIIQRLHCFTWCFFFCFCQFLISRFANDVISQHAEEHKTKKQPLFLYLPFQDVHSPLEVPQKYLKLYPNIKNTARRKFSGKVQLFWEGHKNLRNLPHGFDIYLVTVLFLVESFHLSPATSNLCESQHLELIGNINKVNEKKKNCLRKSGKWPYVVIQIKI